jgi:hypothetical protein
MSKPAALNPKAAAPGQAGREEMENEKARYVLRYYGHLMTTPERLAQRHLFAIEKARHGQTASASENELRNSSHPLGRLLSSDPEVLKLTSDGIGAFEVRTSQRILEGHSNEIFFNYCPRCGALAKTPKARQCRFCRHDWHSGS